MRKRTKAREYALQMLYQVDLTHTTAESSIQDFWAYRHAPQEIQTFATHLVQGTLSRLEELDRVIASHANNWEIARMAVVDRNILRMGAYELLYVDEVPPKVCLNEAVELAKRLGAEESSKFVNGILDTIHKTHARGAQQSQASDGPTPSADTPPSMGTLPATP
jgi:N utilization substance protein B